MEEKTKFCKFCGDKIYEDAILCTKCGRQVEEIKRSNDPNIIINNSAVANARATAINYSSNGKLCNKWVSLALCVFTICGHKFYEGKVGMGILYFFTGGLFCIGWIIDIITISFKPNSYYV